MAAIETGRIVVAPAPARGRVAKTLRALRRWPIIPVLLLSLVIIAGITAPWISPHDPEVGSLRDRTLPPAWMEGGSTEYLLGTDHLGRDVLSRVIYGARISLVVAAVTLGVGGLLEWFWAWWRDGTGAGWMKLRCAWWTSSCLSPLS